MKKTKSIAFLGIMLGVIIVLSVLESLLPPLPFLPPNFRLGLSNVVIMFCVLYIGKYQAVSLNVLKAAFVLLTRGPMAGFLSLCGGLLSVFVLIFLNRVFKEKISITALSITSSVAHNLGQFAALLFALNMGAFVYYMPFALLSGLIMGEITGILLKTLLTAFDKIGLTRLLP